MKMSGQIIVKLAMSLLVALLCFASMNRASAQPKTERQEMLKAGAATIHVTVRGHGDPIVFIPSLGRGVEDFDDLGNRLVLAGYQAILPEPRGIGGSTGPLTGITFHDLAADVAAVIESLNVAPVTLVGHALGNRIARVVATEHPKLVKQVILLAAGGMVPMSPEVDQAFRRVFNPSLPKEARLAAIQRSFFAKGNDARVWEDGWYFNVAIAQASGAAEPPLARWWAGGVVPLLVLQATEDAVAVPENSKRLAAEFPNRVTVVEIPNSGHAMLPEQPERIASAVLAYLRR